MTDDELPELPELPEQPEPALMFEASELVSVSERGLYLATIIAVALAAAALALSIIALVR